MMRFERESGRFLSFFLLSFLFVYSYRQVVKKVLVLCWLSFLFPFELKKVLFFLKKVLFFYQGMAL